VNREYVASWRGRPVYVLRTQNDADAVPQDVASNLQHVIALHAKIERLNATLRQAMEALARSVERWEFDDPETALSVCDTLTQNQIPGRGAVRNVLQKYSYTRHKISYCVYALLLQGKVVYIGRSAGKQAGRVKQHDQNGKLFDEVLLYRCRDRKHMLDLEAVLIDQHEPFYNQRRESRVAGEAS
jgi:hypothetical protein